MEDGDENQTAQGLTIMPIGSLMRKKAVAEYIAEQSRRERMWEWKNEKWNKVSTRPSSHANGEPREREGACPAADHKNNGQPYPHFFLVSKRLL